MNQLMQQAQGQSFADMLSWLAWDEINQPDGVPSTKFTERLRSSPFWQQFMVGW